MTMTENERKDGRVVGIAGPVIDVLFTATAPTEIAQRPVSVNSAATSSSRSAATSSAQRASTAQRDATSRSDHARCAARRRAASAATSAGDATSI